MVGAVRLLVRRFDVILKVPVHLPRVVPPAEPPRKRLRLERLGEAGRAPGHAAQVIVERLRLAAVFGRGVRDQVGQFRIRHRLVISS